MAFYFETVSGKLGLAWAMLTLPRLLEVTRTANKAWDSAGDTVRKMTQKVHDYAEAAAMWGYAASLLGGGNAIKSAADIPDLISNVTELSMLSADVRKIKRDAAVMAPVPQRLRDAMKLSFLKIANKVVTIAGSILGLSALAFGGPIVPIPALLAMGFTTATLSVSSHFFKETRPYEEIDFFKSRSFNGVSAF
jgi:hypothetical protein